MDNSLDACESNNIAPEIRIELQEDAIIVTDNGPGLPLSTLEKSLNYSMRASDKLGYVSPSRGQQGNALKTAWAAAFVATGEGRATVETASFGREIAVTMDRISQVPRVEVTEIPVNVKNGTRITLHWKQVSGFPLMERTRDFYSLMQGFADFNPHLALEHGCGQSDEIITATDTEWPHWRPDRPTNPHWYTAKRLRDLIALRIHADRIVGATTTINEFVREFHGLSGTVKAKTVTSIAELAGSTLADLVSGNDINMVKTLRLLSAMQSEARPVKPKTLGILGEDHLRNRLRDHQVAADSIEYRQITGEADGLPYLIEVAFGVFEEMSCNRLIQAGVNFSPTLLMPFSQLNNALTEARLDSLDPVVLLIHLVTPLVHFTDRGKTRIDLPAPIMTDMMRLTRLVTSRFTILKNRNSRLSGRDIDELREAHKTRAMTTKEAAWQVMEQAYLKASDGGKLPANARQIMYAARPLIIALTGKASPWKHSATFTQVLLPDFMTQHPQQTEKWDVAFDNRGHLKEPHTGNQIGIGTLAVRSYIAGWVRRLSDDIGITRLSSRVRTQGPALRYRFALFIEKEGFSELFASAKIAERHDLAIFSTKGMSTTAARQLSERLSDDGVTILVLHDFDQSGFQEFG
ncbi:hypothetical protein CCP4SC76_410001 [Gammaproteobacteria bacterium]